MKREYDHEKLAFLVDQLGLTPSEVARRVSIVMRSNVHRSLVIRHLRGQTVPKVPMLIAYADLFRVPLDYFCSRR